VRLSSNTTLLAGLKDCLLTQVDAPSVDDVLPVVSRPGGGLVLVGERSIAIAEQLTRGGFLQPILTDRRRYAGKQRAVGTSRFDPRWIVGQQQCALPAVLTDSGYIGQNDFASLDSVLTRPPRSVRESLRRCLSTHPGFGGTVRGSQRLSMRLLYRSRLS
jgi:hypothetical protein